LIDLLGALEDYSVASTSARGEMDQGALPGSSAPLSAAARVGYTSTMPDGSSNSASASSLLGGGFPFPFPFPGTQDSSFGTGGLVPVTAFFNQLIQLSPFSQAMQLSPLLGREGAILSDGQEGEASTREALRFILSPQGAFFRDFVLDEVCGPSVHLSQLGPFSCYYQISSSTRLVPGLQWFLPRPPIMMLSHCLSPLPPPLASFLQVVKSIDALSREQLLLLVQQLGLQAVMLPVLIPGEEPASVRFALAPIPLAYFIYMSGTSLWIKCASVTTNTKYFPAYTRSALILFHLILHSGARSYIPLAPSMTEEDRMVVGNVSKIVRFLTRGQGMQSLFSPGASGRAFVSQLLPAIPTVATEILPELMQKLVSRIGARIVRELYVV
jgi:hypothetical protein